MSQIQVSDPFRAIADPNRRRVLDLLAENPRSVGDLANELSVSQPAVSQQLNILKSAGLVRAQQDGRRKLYSVAAADLREVSDWLGKYQVFWDNRLDGLDRHLAKKLN